MSGVEGTKNGITPPYIAFLAAVVRYHFDSAVYRHNIKCEISQKHHGYDTKLDGELHHWIWMVSSFCLWVKHANT